MLGITKKYSVNQVLANDSIDFRVARGEIHALVGENGAGKTTLVKILDGIEQADRGKIYLNGQPVGISSPKDALKLGIGMVHQHFRLIPQFTVTQNVVLGVEPLFGRVFLDTRKSEENVHEVALQAGFALDPSALVSNLSASEMQQVEIVKALYRAIDLLVLDEPTTILTVGQSSALFENLRNLAAAGRTVIFISHKPDEVMAVSDTVTVLRKGRIKATRKISAIDKHVLSRLMVGGRRIAPIQRLPRKRGRAVYATSNLTLCLKGRAAPALKDISLSVHAAEILGITGIGGNGLMELEDTVCGLLGEQAKIVAGEQFFKGQNVTGFKCAQLRHKSFAYVPSNRLFRGASLESSVQENLGLHQKVGSRQIAEYSRVLADSFSIHADLEMPIGTLSGGNIQKTILARELTLKHDFFLFAEPTWGIDLASSSFVYNEILKLRLAGTAIMVISTDLDEILALSDRIAIMSRGSIVRWFTNDGRLSKGDLGNYMLGVSNGESDNDRAAPGGYRQ